MSWIKIRSGVRKEISEGKEIVISGKKIKTKQRFIDESNKLEIKEKYINRLSSQSDRAVAKFLSGRTPVGRLEKKFKGDPVNLKLLTQLVNESSDSIIQISRQIKADGILELRGTHQFPTEHILRIYYPKLEKLNDDLADHEIMRGVEDFERLKDDEEFLKGKSQEYLKRLNPPENPEVSQKGTTVPDTAKSKVINDDLPSYETAIKQLRNKQIPIQGPLSVEKSEFKETLTTTFDEMESKPLSNVPIPVDQIIDDKNSLQDPTVGILRESVPEVKPHGDIHKPDCSLLQNDPTPIEPDVSVDGHGPQVKSSQEQSSQSMVLPGDIPESEEHKQERLRNQVSERPQEVDHGIEEKNSPEDLKTAGASAGAPVSTTEPKVSKPLDKLESVQIDEVVKKTNNIAEEKTGPVETKTESKRDEPGLKLDSRKKQDSGSGWFSRTWSNIKYAFHNWSIKTPEKIKGDKKLELKQSQIDLMRPTFDDKIMQNLLAGSLDIKTERNVLLKLADTAISDADLDKKLKGMKIFSPEGEYAKVAMSHVETYRNSLAGTKPHKFDKTADEYLRIGQRFIEEVSLNMKKYDIKLEEKHSYA